MKRVEMEIGKIKFISVVGISERWRKILCFTTHKLWRRVCSDHGDLPDRIVLLLHGERDGACTVRIDEDDKPRLVAVGLPTVATFALKKIKGGSAEERLLRAFRAIVLEELLHIHERLSGREAEEPDDYDVVRHYARDFEYRALCYVVKVTGERKELLEAVEAYRAERYVS